MNFSPLLGAWSLELGAMLLCVLVDKLIEIKKDRK